MEMILRRNLLRKDSTVSKTIEMEAGGYQQRGDALVVSGGAGE